MSDYWDAVFRHTKIAVVSILLMIGIIAFNLVYICMLAGTIIVNPGPFLHYGLWIEIAGWLDSLIFIIAVQLCNYVGKNISPWRLWWATLIASAFVTLGIWMCFHI